MGYFRAGFDVVGVDISPQPRYPFDFYQADALALSDFSPFDAIHASPPCQAHTSVRHLRQVKAKNHESFIEPIRQKLHAAGLPYVIENVSGAPLIDPVVLCGSQFGLSIDGRVMRRHRLFETSFGCPPLPVPHKCRRGTPIAGVYGHGGGYTTRGWQASAPDARRLMGIPWMSRDEIAQAIPPIFTHWIGQHLIEVIG